MSLKDHGYVKILKVFKRSLDQNLNCSEREKDLDSEHFEKQLGRELVYNVYTIDIHLNRIHVCIKRNDCRDGLVVRHDLGNRRVLTGN